MDWILYFIVFGFGVFSGYALNSWVMEKYLKLWINDVMKRHTKIMREVVGRNMTNVIVAKIMKEALEDKYNAE